MLFKTEVISVATPAPAPPSLKFEAELFSAPAGTVEEIIVGIILIELGADRPVSLLLRSASFLNGWAVIGNDRSTFEEERKAAGWTLFFMAGQIKTTVFGFDEPKTLHTALKRLARKVKAQHCNSFEITHITRSSFLGIPSVSVSAHARHLQRELVCFGQ